MDIEGGRWIDWTAAVLGRMRCTTPQNVSVRPTLVQNLLSQKADEGRGSPKTENAKTSRKKKETHAAWLDTAKLIEGREWEGEQVAENERMEGKLRSEVTYSLTMEWYPKAEHILTEETVGREKKTKKMNYKR